MKVGLDENLITKFAVRNYRCNSIDATIVVVNTYEMTLNGHGLSSVLPCTAQRASHSCPPTHSFLAGRDHRQGWLITTASLHSEHLGVPDRYLRILSPIQMGNARASWIT